LFNIVSTVCDILLAHIDIVYFVIGTYWHRLRVDVVFTESIRWRSRLLGQARAVFRDKLLSNLALLKCCHRTISKPNT